MDSHLGYSKYDYENKDTDNSRNGYSSKEVRGKSGSFRIADLYVNPVTVEIMAR